MTARRPDAIGAHPQRRLAWARRENERRRQAYETAARIWRRRAEHLDRLSMEAAGFRGCALPGTALPVPLDDGEVVYRILPTVDLVEATAPAPARAARCRAARSPAASTRPTDRHRRDYAWSTAAPQW
nr:hypothetical protein [Micromonospora provocatoris]